LTSKTRERDKARIGAVVGMRVEDYYPKGKRWWVRLHEKGGRLNLRFFDSLVPSIVRCKNQVNLMLRCNGSLGPRCTVGLRPLPYQNP